MPSTILVVDDEDAIRSLLRTALRRRGYVVLEAANGCEALAAMRATPPDVVVLDMMMPVLSGWDVLRERDADETLNRIPVIVISAAPQVAVDVAERVSAYLPKPFDLHALESIVASCLGGCGSVTA